MASNRDSSSDEEDVDDQGSESDFSDGENEESIDEPAMLDSVLNDPELRPTEIFGPVTFKDQDDEVPPSVVDPAGGAPPPKRPRGRPKKKTTPAFEPPPKRPPSPTPQLSVEDHLAFIRRCQERKQEMESLAAKTHLTPDESQRKLSLLVKDEADRHDCCGEWKWEDFPDNNTPFINQDITFQRQEGAQMSKGAQWANSELDLFRLFFTNAVVDNFVKHTNLYARQEGANEGSSNNSWTPVTEEEIMAFIGVAIAMGIHKKKNVREYWSTDSLLEIPWFSQVISDKRFMSIQRYLHVADNTKAACTADGYLCDELYEVRPFLDSLLTSFPQHFFPGRELSIDEQIVGTKACGNFTQFMKGKPTEQGIKVWALCDPKVNYFLNFRVHTGGTSDRDLSFRVVNHLICPFLNKGHHVYFDNFYTSPTLLAHLLSHGTLAVGTVCQNQLHMPIRLRTLVQNFEDGQVTFLRSHKMTVCRWKDKKDVFCLSTVHGNAMKNVPRREVGDDDEQEEVQKPKVICDYNTHVGSIDTYDQLLSYHPLVRCPKQWWLEIFWRLIDMAILNAIALWRLKHSDLQPGFHENFRLNLSEQLVSFLMERNVPKRKRCRVPNRLSHVPDPVLFESVETCIVCEDSSRKTNVGCSRCGEEVRLHINRGGKKVSCLTQYHENYKYN